MILINPVSLQQLVQADIQYSQLNVSTWCSWIDCIGGLPCQHVEVEYGHWTGSHRLDGDFVLGYDKNGSLIEKFTWNTKGTPSDGSDDTELENVVYEYNLQNRLAKVTTTPYINGLPQTASITEYKYDPEGNRVSKTVDSVTTTYLVDSLNNTGYSQVFVEDDGANKTSYIIGDDVLAQATGNAATAPKYILYDGHGSTRQLSDSTGNLITGESYSYDAYGVMLGGNPISPVGTSLLYTGEWFDTDTGNYYLRARWYNPLNGRFNQTDPFAGSPQDPQSLHKYLYAHANPVNTIDPSGKFTRFELYIVFVLIVTITAIIAQDYVNYRKFFGLGPQVRAAAIAQNNRIIADLRQIVNSHGEITFQDLHLGIGGTLGATIPGTSAFQRAANLWESLANVEGYPTALEELFARIGTHSSFKPIPLPDDQTPEQRAQLTEALLHRQEAFGRWLKRDY